MRQGRCSVELGLLFFLNSALLGVGLAMDAFSVSLANGLGEPGMRTRKMLGMAGVFAFFQAFMPMAGWLCVHTAVRLFSAVEGAVPWISLVLLAAIGAKMLAEGIASKEGGASRSEVGFAALVVQGVATSIDALSVGFTIADYGAAAAALCSLIIAAVTFAICLSGLAIGKRFGTRLSGGASVLGGAILIAIGLEIFIKGIFF